MSALRTARYAECADGWSVADAALAGSRRSDYLHPAAAGAARRVACGPSPGRYRIRVEDLDRSIVRLLAADGRMSYTDLGKATGLSTSAVHQRVRRLERRGVIKGYAAVIDPDAVGLALTAFVSIRPIDASTPDDAPDRLADLPEIEACHSVAGDESYILKVRVRTPSDLELLLARIRAAANVSTRTTIVLSTPYEARSPDV